jgi:hypothetical protein
VLLANHKDSEEIRFDLVDWMDEQSEEYYIRDHVSEIFPEMTQDQFASFIAGWDETPPFAVDTEMYLLGKSAWTVMQEKYGEGE